MSSIFLLFSLEFVNVALLFNVSLLLLLDIVIVHINMLQNLKLYINRYAKLNVNKNWLLKSLSLFILF